MTLDPQTQELVRNAELVYDQRLRTRLETEHFGALIALDPESGDFVLADTFREIDVAAQHRFGNKPVHIFRVGGGGAVRIGGVGHHARAS
ncbi:MAG: hypothetical protein NTY19_06975 [Planctomycetota bacterium]|nr:hypothetical protein [Planctomycetota bacterium]